MLAAMSKLLLPPYLTYWDSRRRLHRDTVRYNDHCRLDVWSDTPDWSNVDRPVLIWIPGGAWASGSRYTFQGHPLLHRMVHKGWTCLSISYRTLPLSRWPAPLEDVQDAVLWARSSLSPNFLALAGGSAGGHLATLAGLQSFGDAVISLYGSYDWEFRGTLWRKMFMHYIETYVVGQRQSHNPQLFREASPMAQVHRMAPAMCLIHGTKDRLISINEAKLFKAKLEAVSQSPVRFLEVPCDHGFDMYHSTHSRLAMRVAEKFLSDMVHLKGVKAPQPSLFSVG